MKPQFILALVAMVALSGCEAKTKGAPATAASPVAAHGRWFVSAANPYAVEAGAAVLARGGSAVDAAIAVEAVLSLVEPQSSGFGGGGFMMHFDPATGALETYDGRETAPMSATPDRFIAENGAPMDFMDAVAGGLSVGVPGVVAMLAEAHREHGDLPWADLLAPATALADEGFKVSPRLSDLLGQATRLRASPAAAAYFYEADGRPRAPGYVLKNPEYAAVLRTLAAEGPGAFYKGAIADSIVEAVAAAPNPGGMTLADIAAYRPVKRAPVCGPYRTLIVCSMAPPSSGGVTLLQILGMLEGHDLKAMGAGSPEALHVLIEASKLAYADREKYLADNDANAVAADGLTSAAVIAGLLNPPYVAARATLVDLSRAADTVSAGDPSQYPIAAGAAPGAWAKTGVGASYEPPSTTHFTIVDARGRVVSMTATVEFAFGSHQMAKGMVLNNQLTDFSFLPISADGKPVANAVGPGKRPRSSMTPVVLFDQTGAVKGALGSPGGPAIMGYVAKTIIAAIDWGMPMQQAIDYPNIVIPRGAPAVEKGGFDLTVVESLRQRGHAIMERELTSGVHGFIVATDGSLDGGADKRREGAWKTGVFTPAK
jgi:gamma-glutamyltranspeptidase/glutathione hydrolase